MAQRVVCFGPGPQFKGGMAQYTVSLARALQQAGAEVHLVSWTQQYPAIVPRDFIDRASRRDHLADSGIPVTYITDYNNPLSWWRTVRYIAGLQPDRVVFQWSIALQGLPMGWMMRWLRRHTQAELLVDLHFVVQKEHSALDRICSRYGLTVAHSYIVHACKTAEELQQLFPRRTFQLSAEGLRAPGGETSILKLYHPIYDLYQPDPAFDRDAVKRELGLRTHVFFFFGFIRKYKGLHWVLEAFAALARERDDVSLLIVGESFWQTLPQGRWSTRVKQAVFGLLRRLLSRKNADDERGYDPLARIPELGLEDRVVVVNRYVGNEEVPRYFQVADAMMLYYEYATPSGVESMAYNFRLPVLATAVGHFPETVEPGVNGYLARPGDVADMTAAMRRMLTEPIPREGVDSKARQLSWARYAAAILQTEA